MKNTIYLLILLFSIACSSNTENKKKNSFESEYVQNILNDISTIEQVDSVNPILLFKRLAKQDAKMILSISADNMDMILREAKAFRHCIITTGDHTLIKITDLENCQQSGSWKVCMPYAKGYIKKQTYTYQEDFVNNLIGIPDDQERKAFLFN